MTNGVYGTGGEPIDKMDSKQLSDEIGRLSKELAEWENGNRSWTDNVSRGTGSPEEIAVAEAAVANLDAAHLMGLSARMIMASTMMALR